MQPQTKPGTQSGCLARFFSSREYDKPALLSGFFIGKNQKWGENGERSDRQQKKEKGLLGFQIP
ncbi:MAG: hypothetical protein ABFD75_07480 [Smithella sp.]